MNPQLSMHAVYARTYNGTYIPEHYRKAFTRMRTSSHRLRIETGRWARIAREQRLCQCGVSVQDEQHVMMNCLLTEHIRNAHQGNFPAILSDIVSEAEFKFVFDVLNCCE